MKMKQPNVGIGHMRPIVEAIIIPRSSLMITERFKKLRKSELAKVFSKKNIADVWRKIVRDQLRKASDIYDIFDYYDFNYNIDERALIIRAEILNGDYQCSRPLIYRLEKKLGICRHIIMPQPVDSLVLQIITEALYREIIAKQPSPNAFYSRDKHNVQKPHEIDEYGMHWLGLWKKLQKVIYQFGEMKELVVVTDLSNYYDSIDMGGLRKAITHFVDGKEVLLDLLFKIIEKITWCPDYLPYSGRGLPTTNIEAIRLLGHSFLFELDAILQLKTNNSFARWMDDIVIGADSRKEAAETLSSAADVLKSRGLALHLAKTDIYDSEDAKYHFQIESNKYLDTLEGYFKDISTAPYGIDQEIMQKFQSHLLDRRAKYWEKVTKRYITAFGRLRSNLLLADTSTLYREVPGVRPNLLMYLSNMGFTPETAATVLDIALNLSVYDDVSLFQVCKLVTDWNIETSKTAEEFLMQFEDKISTVSKQRKEPFDFFCLLWLKSKYEDPINLYMFIMRYKNIWGTSPFLRRQVTALMARILSVKEEEVRKFLSTQISIGELQIASLANQILLTASLSSLERKVKMYLFPKAKPRIYPLYKFLVLCSFLNSSQIREKEDVKQKIGDYINDHYFLKWLNVQYDIQ